jgi:predicted TIM-barrel fold metal-dependent hydrolase
MMGFMRTIALEEHFWTDELAAAPGTGLLARADGAALDGLLRDVGAARIADMDAAGIDVQVLSHVQPAAQGLRGADGVAAARRANDYLAAVTASSAGRLAGFATLPTGSPAEAAEELSRCVGSLGFTGGLINSTLGPNDRFLDDPSFAVLLSRFAALDVPLYLHRHSRPRPSAPRSTTVSRHPSRARSPPMPGAGTPRRGCTRCGLPPLGPSRGTRGCG